MALSLTPTSQGEHSLPNVLLVGRDEFNDEIWGYLTQLHQEQMRKRAQNPISIQLPAHAQQALNLNTAFVKSSRRLVEGMISVQIECEDCQQLHEICSERPYTSDQHAQVLEATKLLDSIVDAHVNHKEADNADEYGYRLAKLSLVAIQEQLRASKRLGSRMKEVADLLWIAKQAFDSGRFENKDMLRLEWNMIKDSLKTLYHHFLYFFNCLDAAEDVGNGLEREEAITRVVREQKAFSRTAALLSSNSSEQDTSVRFTKSSSHTRFPLSLRDTGKSIGPLKDTALTVDEACARLLDSLRISDLNFQSPETPKNLANDTDTARLLQQHKTFGKMSQQWVSRSTGNSLPSSWSANIVTNSKHANQLEEEPPTDGSGDNSSDRVRDESVQTGQESQTRPTHQKLVGRNFGRDNNNDENDDGKESEKDDDRRKKRQRLSATSDLRGFACPYFQRDPEKHGKSKACAYTNFETLHRLKEHILRTHKLPLYCRRCRSTFPHQEELDEHEVQVVACDVRKEPVFVGYTELMKEKLKSRKKGPNGEANKWKEIYLILFPNDDASRIPSHYHDVQFTAEQYFSLAKQRTQEELTKYDEFQRQVLPVLIQEKLDVSTETPYTLNFERLSSIIDESLSEALILFRFSNDDFDVNKTNYNHSSGHTSTFLQSNGNSLCTEGTFVNPISLNTTPRSNGCEQVPSLGMGSLDLSNFILGSTPMFGSVPSAGRFGAAPEIFVAPESVMFDKTTGNEKGKESVYKA